jgi:TonB family protein
MEKGETYQLFTPSGCLTEEALFRHTGGLLQAAELRLVDDHVQACELCALALEGFALADQDSFSEDVNQLNQAFSRQKEISDVLKPEEVAFPEEKGDFEGPRFPRLSQEEMRDFSRKIIEIVPEPAKTIAPDAGIKPRQGLKKTFWLKYRSELIAATLLLLIAIGGRQVYLELNHSRNSKNQTALTVKPDQVEESLVELPIKPELREEDGIITQKQIAVPPPVLVENELSDKVIEETFDDVQIEETIPSTAGKAQTIAAGNAGKSVKETSEIKELMTDQYIEGVVVSKKAKNADRLSQEMDEEETAEAEVFTVVEESPQFPGGDEARVRFLQENIHYPDEAREASIQGTVYISFVIEIDGTINDIRVLRGIGGGCDEEAVRVIRNMPRWLPGKQRGKPVRVQFNMPIKFSLAG